MRYDDDLTSEAVNKWIEDMFKCTAKIYNFKNNFVAIIKNSIILINKSTGTVEIQSTTK
jgi:hypothetical protein